MSQCMDVCLPGPKKVVVVKRWALAEVRLGSLCVFNTISTDTNQGNIPQISTTVGSHIFHCPSPSLPIALTLLEQLRKMLKVFPQGPLG